MSLQIKKSHCLPKLLAQICTKMEEWVRVILLLSNQSEVPKAYDTEKQTKKKKTHKKPRLPTSKMSDLTEYLDLKHQLISDTIEARWLQVPTANSEPSAGGHWDPSSSGFWDAASGCWLYKNERLCTCSQGAGTGGTLGLTQVCKHIHLYKDAWVKRGDKWRASCSCPPLELLSAPSGRGGSHTFGSY